ncbi:unnamed protein product [Clonostachys byssicola]|uniref:Major facilitator superfamily (MFS) profile domain-containing protein n=1 Tax=Clonostachys byssicola TaxID=160290 RepID=A0A9N9U7A6_9HYPO|nr:unnamed protein product [Clonostachys byssicola]
MLGHELPSIDADAKNAAQHVEVRPTTAAALRREAASRQSDLEKQLSFFRSLSVFWRSTLWVLYGQLVVFGYGIDGLIAGNLLAIPKFRYVSFLSTPLSERLYIGSPVPVCREDYGELFGSGDKATFIIPATWQSIYGGVAQLAAILGAVITGWMADKIGRRYTNLLFCCISVVGVAVQYISTQSGSLPILTAGKAINGLSIGAWLVIGPLYASEVAPLQLRGWLTAMTNIIQFSGTLLFTGIMYQLGPRNEKSAYIIPFTCQWAIPCLVILTIWPWPESPVWLVRMGRIEEAKKALLRLHGRNSGIDREGILAVIEESIVEEHEARDTTKAPSYLDAFSPDDRKRTLTCMFIYGCQYFSGIIFVLGYQSYYYQLAGFDAKFSFLLGMLNNCSMFVANILSWPLLTIVGRRPLIVWGQFVCALTLLIVGATSIPGDKQSTIATISFMFVWGFCYQITLGTVAWTVVAEIPSFRLRSRTQGLSNLVLCLVQWLIGFIFPYIFNPDAGNLSGKVGFIFGGTTLIGFIGCWFLLPETKDRPVAELDYLYKAGVKPRHFSKTKMN